MLLIFLEDAHGQFEAYIFEGCQVGFALNFRKTNYFLLERSIEGSIGITTVLMILNSFADAICFLLYIL